MAAQAHQGRPSIVSLLCRISKWHSRPIREESFQYKTDLVGREGCGGIENDVSEKVDLDAV